MNETRFVITVNTEKNLTDEECKVTMKVFAEQLQGLHTTCPEYLKEAYLNIECEAGGGATATSTLQSNPYLTIFSTTNKKTRYQILKGL
jgi:hypothetical protein